MKLSNILPAPLMARIRFHLHPGGSNPYGGAFNGQCGRQQIFMDLLHTFAFTHVVETGTFYGVTTEFMAREARLPVFTVEAFRPAYELAKIRLRQCQNVHLFLGDSRSFLRQIAESHIQQDATPFFYLDAHWEEDLPLHDEIRIVLGSYARCVVMIDDFQVPHDAGYAFDDFGPSGSLTPGYLNAALRNAPPAIVAYPRLPSARESGSRRGCVILVPLGLAHELGSISTLVVEEVRANAVGSASASSTPRGVPAGPF